MELTPAPRIAEPQLGPDAAPVIPPGYKQTEVGVIPEDWNVIKLGENAAFRTGPYGSALHKSDYVENCIPVINPIHIDDGNLIPDQQVTVSEHLASKLSDFFLKREDIVIARRGEMGRCAVVRADQEGWLCGSGSMIIRCSASLVPEFVQRVLSSPQAVASIEGSSVGSTMINLNQGVLSGLSIQCPPTLAEQQAIAAALGDADAYIDALAQRIAKQRLVKQGAMQELLTGKRRLPRFAGAWEVKRLGELGSTFGGLTGKTKNDFGHGSARYITFMNIMTNVVIDNGTFESVDVGQAESQHSVVKGDLFFNGSSETPEEVGMCAVLLDDAQNVYLNSFCFGFRLRDNVIASGLYLAYYFRSQEGRSLLKSLAQGATRYNLSKTALLDTPFPLPTFQEQTAIAAILSDMDAAIAALEAKLAKARLVKQGMMQALLTGRVRLV